MKDFITKLMKWFLDFDSWTIDGVTYIKSMNEWSFSKKKINVIPKMTTTVKFFVILQWLKAYHFVLLQKCGKNLL